MRAILLRKCITILLLIGLLISCTPIKRLQRTPIGLINNIAYKDSLFNNPNASNGFLMRYKHNDYAITAKHILIIAKTDRMKFVDFEGDLKQWKMHPKQNKTNDVILEALLNTNHKDSLTWSYMDTNWDTYNDWLVFSIKENNTNHKALKVRKRPLKKGEDLYIIGWSYKDTISDQPIYKYQFDKTEGNYHNLIEIAGPTSLGGLSGSPVVDKKGRVVGLVSSGWEDEKTKQVFIQATSIKNAVHFIATLDSL